MLWRRDDGGAGGLWDQEAGGSSWGFTVGTDGVQVALSPNMVLWCIKYLNLKEFFKWQKQEGHSALPPLALLPWKGS